jgi:glycosyltransferase involved in cell wall biosynthesis
MNWCVVIPTYNNEKTLELVINNVLQVTGNVIVVNDGSTDGTADILQRFSNIRTISYNQNRGKGYALQQGFRKALQEGFHYAITLDSDGQHSAADIRLFTDKISEFPEALMVGSRTLPEEKLRKGSGFANRFSNLWFRLITGVSLPDTQSGFRLYPLVPLSTMKFFTRKYEFELEVLIRSAWKGILLMNIPINVYYPEKKDRVSHFRPFRDFIRISILNTICVFIALLYVKPFSFIRFLKKENIRTFLKKNVLQTGESTEKLTFSVMLGVFMGIFPIWGYQLITAIALAYLLRLNKVIVILAANISLPPLIPFILYLSYIIGGFVLSANTPIPFNSSITLEWVKSNLIQYLVGACVFAIIAAILSGLLTFILLKVFRKKNAILN